MTDHSRVTLGTIYLGIGLLFYVSAWKTQNMEYVTIANLSMLLFVSSAIIEIIIAFRSKNHD